MANDDFLTLVLVCVLIETLRTAFNRHARDEPEDLSTSLIDGLAGAARSSKGPLPNGSTALATLGCVMPIGSVPLAFSVLIGPSAPETVAALAIPSAICAALWALNRLFSRRRGRVDRSAPIDGVAHVAALFARASSAGALIAVAVPICAIVVLGLGRPVEAVGVVAAATASLCALVIRSRAGAVPQFIGALTNRVAAVVFCLLTGACLAAAADSIGYPQWTADLATWSGAGVAGIVAVGVVVTPLLLRWFSPLTVALLMVPTFPPAFKTAGAGSYQTLALCCGIVAAGLVGRAFVDDAEAAGKRPLFGWLCVTVGLVFAYATVPAIAEFLPKHLRVW
jgi:hypothetical protein